MDVEIVIKNYRCFQDISPARIRIQKGFTSFIGVNNSGKSSLLKFLYEFRRFLRSLSQPSDNILSGFRGATNFVIDPGVLRDTDEIFCTWNNRSIELDLIFRDDHTVSSPTDIGGITKAAFEVKRNFTYTGHLYKGDALLNLSPVNLHFQGTNLAVGGHPGQPAQPVADLTQFADTFNHLHQTMYIGPFRNAIHVQADQSYFDISVGVSFIRSWREAKTSQSRKQRDGILRITEDIRRIFGYKNLEIDAANGDQDLLINVDSKSYRLSELGSGLAQFIVVLGNVAIRQPSFILIDEPELNLHPSLQIDFLTTLGSYASEGVLFATHNIGLARAISNRIYSVRKGENEVREVIDFESLRQGRLSEFVGELSFAGYKDLGFDKLLLVEGPTEVPTMQQLLRKVGKDHQIVMLPLGGDTMINGKVELQLQEIKRITDKIYALIDSERETENAPLKKGREEFRSVCQSVGIHCHVLHRCALENYFTERAVQAALTDRQCTALGPYEKLKDGPYRWGKTENWKIAREMTMEELAGTDLREFLDNL